ncbi:TetR/AcrR family transcriptional regulator [Piscinibacter terrae]|uniref:TetR/AcrR family transcriptional regulator n=1 Tax=Piscinibacter terrae TaxID=2496871 RepID=A0A3N7HNW4_9BURK|nr:TetR/AcrR family transcriptional regulator [Albitalea terrae]RQP23810.1 TetR/AcrR family transcriptional regulator [Albitalea terrae]
MTIAETTQAIARNAAQALSEHKRRLLDAMSHVVARKGYAETTIADLAAEARVSRRTFYEHFDTKAECLIALFEVASDQALTVLKSHVDPRHDWHTQVEQALSAYLSTLACNPTLLRTLFIAILGLGAEGLAARRKANQQLADFILEVVNSPAQSKHRKGPMPASDAMGIVGAINELILQAIEENRVERLAELTPDAARLAQAVIDGTA